MNKFGTAAGVVAMYLALTGCSSDAEKTKEVKSLKFDLNPTVSLEVENNIDEFSLKINILLTDESLEAMNLKGENEIKNHTGKHTFDLKKHPLDSENIIFDMSYQLDGEASDMSYSLDGLIKK